MANKHQRFLTASCGDLMLARDCVSDLKSAFFRGSISVRPSETTDFLQGKSLQGFGSDYGGLAGNGIFFGGLLGLAAGAGLSYVIDSETPYLPAVLLALGLGAHLRWRNGVEKRSGESRALRKGREHQGRFILRCDGTPDDIATAFEALRNSACRNLHIHGDDGDIANLIAVRETEVLKA